MPIHHLAYSTANRISSTQVLLDPFNVVKELLDNALDARAASVSIEVSSNTLDVIQVHDTGHGIAPDDRALICVRHCTSKIREFDDLRSLGGRSLGFRGEALNSLSEIAGGLSITTRVEGETAGMRLEMGKDGEITKSELILFLDVGEAY